MIGDIRRTKQSANTSEKNRLIRLVRVYLINSVLSRYLGVWYHKIQVQTVIWVTNRERPILDRTGVLNFTENGTIVILNQTGTVFWSSSSTTNTSTPRRAPLGLWEPGFDGQRGRYQRLRVVAYTITHISDAVVTRNSFFMFGIVIGVDEGGHKKKKMPVCSDCHSQSSVIGCRRIPFEEEEMVDKETE
ncbi:G-type lectin S-receptor-like serine/threonine-protein kinase [Acorus calamus]|uniref:G-type lectin S-receptor-like serine/threonine-protein kinase n=1 Tax=Acorus calamus TaxID=4465 RepID=A0AAV9C751_ACOCL|nr:G-type lectin S-receptor-like serine/threonine-protein kinase [Acorus calamus]